MKKLFTSIDQTILTKKQQAYEEKLKLTLKRKMPISVAALTGIDSKQFFK
jgi:hypothetical protein